MVAPKVAKPQTKAAADSKSGLELQRSTLVARSFGRSTVEQAYMLQRSIGNQATLRLLSQRDLSPTGKELGDDRQPEAAPEPPDRASRAQPSSPLAAAPLAGAVQAKLVVGDVNDPLEHEADRVADLVMRMDDSEPSMSAIPLQVSRKCAAYEDETKTVRSKRAELANPAAGEAPSIVLDVLSSPARPLDPAVRAQFEPLIGYDLGQVRVHTDGFAARSAAAVGARAYTVGRDVIFGAGQYAPGTDPGKRLLVHELAHVAQQSALAATAYAHDATISGHTGPMRGPQTGATGILQRQSEQGPRSPGSTIDPTRQRLLPDERTRIDRFLQQHQVVLFLRENRAWLDGQRTSVDQVIARVRREAQVLLPDDDVIASYIDAQFYQYLPGRGAPASAGSAGGEPPSTVLRPGIPVPFGFDRGDLVLTSELSFADASRIRNYLATNGLAVGPGLVPVFRGSPSTLDQIVELLRALVLPIIPRERIAGVVQAEWSRLVLRALRLPLPPPPPFTIALDVPLAEAEAPEKLQSAIGWQGTWHLRQSGRAEHTIQVQLTQGDGPIQRVYQFQVNATTGDAQAMVGAQVQSPEATLVDTQLFHAIHAVVKASAFLQLVGGITNAGGTAASGSLTVQLQAGIQITATLGPVNVTVQAGPTLTLQQGQEAGVDFNPAVQGGAAQLPSGQFPPFHGIPLIEGRF